MKNNKCMLDIKEKERNNLDLIAEQIIQKKTKSPDNSYNKFGFGAMNREEFLINKSILLDISRKKMELLGPSSAQSQTPL